MTLTVPHPSGPAPCSVRSVLTTPIVRTEGSSTVVVLDGETDFSTKRVLAGVLCELTASGTGDVVIDLAEVAFIDTATVRVLAVGQQLLDSRGRKLTFRRRRGSPLGSWPCSASPI